jgi:hypothetical protein
MWEMDSNTITGNEKITIFFSLISNCNIYDLLTTANMYFIRT